MPRLEDNVAATVAAVGLENVGLVWGLATYNWPSEQERDAFLQQVKLNGVNTVGEGQAV